MPLTLYSVGKLPGQSLVATSVTGQPSNLHSRLFFITDKNNSLKFLIDTGAEVSLLPASHSDRKRRQTGFSLQTANNSDISTYRTRSLTLDFNLHRPLPWVFTIADVRHAILGADFIRHYQLLIDMQRKQLIDSVTHSRVQGVTSPHFPLHPVWHVITPSNVYTQLLDIYQSITRPPTLNQPIKHFVLHYIKTTGPSVRCRTRLLAPDRLKIARQEFDYMLQLGIIRL